MKRFFRSLTHRATEQVELSNEPISLYLADLLVDFSHTGRLYRFGDADAPGTAYLCRLMERAGEARGEEKQAYYKQVGDHSLFVLGMFPEPGVGLASALVELGYTHAGRRSYFVSSQLEPDPAKTRILRDLAEEFESCVLSLNWVQKYITDPFYRYMLREFGVT